MQTKKVRLQVLILTACGLGLAATAAHAATFTVNSLFDDTFSDDSNPGDGVCRDSFPSSTDCTLRAAIQEANALAGPDRIEFSVAGEIGPDTGNLGALPVVTDDLVIAATTAPQWSPLQPSVYLNGTAVEAVSSSFAAGLEVTSGSLEVFGLGIVGFPGPGIDFDNGPDGGTVDGCVIGLDENGDPVLHPESLSTVGVKLSGSNAVIGDFFGNVISGNESDGIQIFGDANTISRNIIGMTLDGLTARGNGGNGIFLFHTADDNLVGGTDPGSDPGNHIANNARAGMVVDGTNNIVEGNTFGFKPGDATFFSATTAIEVSGDGHRIGGSIGNRILDHGGAGNFGILLGRTPPGGDVPATNVLVEGNDIGTESFVGPEAGIRVAVAGSSLNTIRGNRIAKASSGIELAADGNQVAENRLGIDPEIAATANPGNSTGIQVRSASNEILSNTIGNSGFFGIRILGGSSNDIKNNDIGFAPGLGEVGNERAGIQVSSGTDNLIQGNRILNNGGPAVAFSNALNGISGNTIFGNLMQQNAGIGIDFIEFDSNNNEIFGPTENDAGDADIGANLRMNHPDFGEADLVPGTDPVETVVTFRVDSDPANQAYPITVDFYQADGYGEFSGSAFMASAVYETFGAEETITLTLPAGIGIDRHFTALATDADGNTSEFAPARSLGEVLFRDGYED